MVAAARGEKPPSKKHAGTVTHKARNVVVVKRESKVNQRPDRFKSVVRRHRERTIAKPREREELARTKATVVCVHARSLDEEKSVHEH